MKSVLHIARYSFRDLIRNKWGIVYSVFFAAVTYGLFLMQSHGAKVSVSLISISLFLIPIMSSLFGIIYVYNSREYIELMLTQPVSRTTVFMGLFCGIAGMLVLGFVSGVSIPFVISTEQLLDQILSLSLLLSIGTLLTLIFLGLSFLFAVMFDDRGKGIAATIGVWLCSALLYDGLILLAAVSFSEYPLEGVLLAASLLNPIDLARVTLLLQTDWAALMGYTGAVFNKFFGTTLGVTLAFVSLSLWSTGPFLIGLHKFRRKDL